MGERPSALRSIRWRERPRLQLPPHQDRQLNGIVDRGFQLGAGLDLFTSEADGGDDGSSNQEGTPLFLVVGHVNIIGEQKANIKSDGLIGISMLCLLSCFVLKPPN